MGDYMIELLPTGVLCIHASFLQSSEPGLGEIVEFRIQSGEVAWFRREQRIDHSVHITNDKETYKKKDKMSLLFTFNKYSISPKTL